MHVGLLPSRSVPCFEQFQHACEEGWKVSAADALFRSERDFMPGSLSLCWEFWDRVILVGNPMRDVILPWLQFGVKIESFLAPFSIGNYNGVDINSRWPQFYREENHVAPAFQHWVSSQIKDLVRTGVMRPWDERCMSSKVPIVIAPLIVEPSKPRLIYDARYINCFLSLPSVDMSGAGKIPSCCWKDMYLITLDHKSGYFHVPLHPSSWTYFGVSWQNEVYCYTTLTFGWSPSAYIYCTLTGACSQCVRRITASPVLDWVDDVCSGTSALHKDCAPVIQFESANRTAFVLSMVLFFAGYFVNLPKSCLFPTRVVQFLGVIVDSARTMFFVPPKKVDKLLSLIKDLLASDTISASQLERVVGKCRSMYLAVPSAVLYTRVQYAALEVMLSSSKSRKWSRSRGVSVISPQLREELAFWLELGTPLLNGSHWTSPGHFCVLLQDFVAHADSSSRRWAGVVVSSRFPFQTAADFGEADVHLHINEKEAIAFWKLMCNFLPFHRDEVRRKKLLVHTDNLVLYYIYKAQGSSVNLNITSILKKLFWLQLEYQCVIDLKWIPSADNLADPLTRVPVLEDLRLNRKVFLMIWKKLGPFSMDLMASPSNAQLTPSGVPLPFFSQYFVQGCEAVDVFSIDLRPHLARRGLFYCFPPFSMIDNFLAHLQECSGKCVVILPENFGLWYPKFACGVKKVIRLSEVGSRGAVLCFKKNAFHLLPCKYAMIAALLDYSSVV